MKKAYRTMLKRSVKQTRARFFSILAIVAVGVAFLSGLKATTPDMQNTVDRYYDDCKVYDIDIKSTMGFNAADLQAVAKTDGVKQVMGASVTDLPMIHNNEMKTVRLYGVPFAERGSEAFLNDFVLTEGRLPEKPDEVVLCSPDAYAGAYEIGELFIRSGSTDPENKLYSFKNLKVVGLVRTPNYMTVEAEPTTVGSGHIDAVLYGFPSLYVPEDFFTDCFVLAEGASELNTFSDGYETQVSKLEETLKTLGKERCDIRLADVKQDAQSRLDEQKATFETEKKQAEDKLAAGEKELLAGKNTFASALAAWQKGTAELNEKETAFHAEKDKAESALHEKRAQLEQAKPALPPEQFAAMEAALNQAEQEANAKFSAAEAGLRAGREELSAAKTKLDASKHELEKAEQELKSGRKEAEKQLHEGEKQLAAAQEKVDQIQAPKWVLQDRQMMVSHVSYQSNSEKIGAIAKVFPIFFFFVAALVALTTMTRMVEEERTQIGTLKALGFQDGAVLFYYIAYSALASFLGAAIGFFAGSYLFPAVINNAYTMMYVLPPLQMHLYWSDAAKVVSVAVLCTTLATLFACAGQLRERPAFLMRPRAPKAGKRILLERITPLWKRMSFLGKVTSRNIFRYRKRLYMTVFGVAGCTALLLTGFGLRDSIGDIVKKQYDEIYQYDASLMLEEETDFQSDDACMTLLQSGAVEHFGAFSSENVTVSFGDEKQTAALTVPQKTEDLPKLFNLRQRKSGEKVAFDDDSLVLTEKLCELLGVSVGDEVTLQVGANSVEKTVTGIAENYVSSYVFMPQKAAADGLLSGTPRWNRLIVSLTEDGRAHEQDFSERLLETDSVLTVSLNSTVQESFKNTVRNINYIVIVLIISAGALAMIVLYNLININICERRRELASLRVLGFRDGETAAYIDREIAILCCMGIAVGLVFGVFLHAYVVQTAEVDAVMFGRNIYLRSYLLSAGMTLLFAALSFIIMLPKIRSIDLAESMKAAE